MLKSLIDIKRDKVFTGKRQKKKALILEVNDILKFEELPQEPIPELDKRLKGLYDHSLVIAPVVFNTKERKQCVLVNIDPQDLVATLHYSPRSKYDNGKTISKSRL